METPSFVPSLTLRQAVGIDMANLSFEAVLGAEKFRSQPKLSKSESFENQASGFVELIQWVAGQEADPKRCLFVMEATGVYYEPLAHWLHDQGYQVVVLLANTVVSFAKSLNVKTKSDQVDAGVLAHMGCERQLDTWQPPLKEYKELKQLTRLRQRLVHQRSMLKNQQHATNKQALSSSFVIDTQQELILFLSKKILQLEKHIRNLIQAHDELEQKYNWVCSIPGMGDTTAAILLAETQGFLAFRNQAQLVSYAGLDVIKRQSGTSIKYKERISKKGNHRIRKALFFPAMVAPKHIPAFERLYKRINEKNPDTKMKGAVALQRKLLVLAYQLCKKQQAYEPNKMI